MSPETRRSETRSSGARRAVASIVFAVLALATTHASQLEADDRLLIDHELSQPYVFFLLDSSRSLHQPATELGTSGDSPTSRLRRLKDGLYEFLSRAEPGLFGFARLAQGDAHVLRRQTAYTAVSTTASGAPPISFPAAGEVVWLGRPAAHRGSCLSPIGGSLHALQTYFTNEPLAELGAPATTFVFSADGAIIGLEATARPTAGASAATLELRWLTFASAADCAAHRPARVGASSTHVVPEIAHSSFGPLADREGPLVRQIVRSDGAEPGLVGPSTCGSPVGWEANENPATGHSGAGPFSIATTPDPLGRDPSSRALDRGDVIPWDWWDRRAFEARADFVPARHEIQRRLAANVASDSALSVSPGHHGEGRYLGLPIGALVPDTRVASFLHRETGSTLLTPDAGLSPVPPLLSGSGKPIAAALRSFVDWFDRWAPTAHRLDTRFACRARAVILLTDGSQTCEGEANLIAAAAALGQRGVRLFVVSIDALAPHHQVLADVGGTGRLDQNGDGRADCAELDLCPGPSVAVSAADVRRALDTITAGLRRGSPDTQSPPIVTGIAAGDPTIQATARPVPHAYWSGDVARQDEESCAFGECGSWSAAGALLGTAEGTVRQAPVLDDSSGALRIGPAEAERRLLVPTGAALSPRLELFDPRRLDDVQVDELLAALRLPRLGDPRVQLHAVVHELVKPRRLDDGRELLLGDSLHSPPLLVGPPDQYISLVAAGHGNGGECALADDGSLVGGSYRCFAEFHRYRRNVVFYAANDGQVHAFDAGWRATPERDAVAGTGQELFSFIPRQLLGSLPGAGAAPDHRYRADGPLIAKDVLLRPPGQATKEWRTLILGGLGRGGAGIFALDVTQPDAHPETEPTTYLPTCFSTGDVRPGCAGRYPDLLWTFVDREDRDDNGSGDMAPGWSHPVVSTLRVRTADDDVEERAVAVVGGGYDPEALRPAGNWIYFVDLETGRPLYKRETRGAVASEPATVDLNDDGILDAVYFGTTDGAVHRIVTTPPAALSVDGEIETHAWPLELLTELDGPVFLPPALITLEGESRLAVAVGTGDRADLLAESGERGRVYVFVEPEPSSALDVATLRPIGLDDASIDEDLLSPSAGVRGYALELRREERLVEPILAVAGLVTFRTFQPRLTSLEDGDCRAPSGTFRRYRALTKSGDPLTSDRDKEVSPSLSPTTILHPSQHTSLDAAPLSEQERAALERLRRLQPGACPTSSARLSLGTLTQQGDFERQVPIPVCIVHGNWKER